MRTHRGRSVLFRSPAVVGLLLGMVACGTGEERGSSPSPGSDADPATVAVPDSAAPTPDVTLQVSPGEIRIEDGRSGGARTVAKMDGGSEAVFVAAALRPGSTGSMATIVAVVRDGGQYGLRWLTVGADGPGPLRAFPDRYTPAPSDRSGLARPSVTWTPDGGSVAWLDWTEAGGTVLRTVGWSDGPGTGDTATDNAAFTLDAVPPGSRIAGWSRGYDAVGWTMEMVSPDGDRWLLRVERQADGALALPRPDGGNPCRAPCQP